MRLDSRQILAACGVTNAVLALFHVGCAVVGGPAYRLFGAGPMVQLAEAGSLLAPSITLAIAALLAGFAAYAFSGAGVIRRLPLLKLGLVVSATIYTLRGLFLLPLLVGIVVAPGVLGWTDVIFGVICGGGALALGIGYFVGMRRASSPRAVMQYGRS